MKTVQLYLAVSKTATILFNPSLKKYIDPLDHSFASTLYRDSNNAKPFKDIGFITGHLILTEDSGDNLRIGDRYIDICEDYEILIFDGSQEISPTFRKIVAASTVIENTLAFRPNIPLISIEDASKIIKALNSRSTNDFVILLETTSNEELLIEDGFVKSLILNSSFKLNDMIEYSEWLRDTNFNVEGHSPIDCIIQWLKDKIKYNEN